MTDTTIIPRAERCHRCRVFLGARLSAVGPAHALFLLAFLAAVHGAIVEIDAVVGAMTRVDFLAAKGRDAATAQLVEVDGAGARFHIRRRERGLKKARFASVEQLLRDQGDHEERRDDEEEKSATLQCRLYGVQPWPKQIAKTG
jgi:hypothetical protein